MRRSILPALLVAFVAAPSVANPKKIYTFKQAKKKFGHQWALGYVDAHEEYRGGGMAAVTERIAFYTSVVAASAGYRNTSTKTDIVNAFKIIKSARSMATAAAQGRARDMFEAYYDAANTIFKHGGDAVGRRMGWDFVHRMRGAIGFWKQIAACQKTAEAKNDTKSLIIAPISDGKKAFDPRKDPPAKEVELYGYRSKQMLPKGTTGEVRGETRVDWKGGPGKDGAWHVHRNADGSYQRYFLNDRGHIEIEGLPYWKSLRDMLAAREKRRG